MMRQKHDTGARLRLAIVWMLILILLGGCSSQSPTPSDVLERILASEGEIPVGTIHLLSAMRASEEEKLNLLASTYGDGTLPPELELAKDAAFYFSFSTPYECAVFCCKSPDQTEDVAKLCLKRIETLKSYWGTEDEYSYVQNATVSVKGHWVFFCVSPSVDNAVRAFRRAV